MCDSESSEDELAKELGENTASQMDAIDGEYQDEIIKPKPYKRKTKSKGAKDEQKKVLKNIL